MWSSTSVTYEQKRPQLNDPIQKWFHTCQMQTPRVIQGTQ